MGSKKTNNKWSKQEKFNPKSIHSEIEREDNILQMNKKRIGHNNQKAITPYQYTRGVRFRADITRNSDSFRKKYKAYKGMSDENAYKRDFSKLKELVKLLSSFHAEVNSILFDPKTEEIKFRNSLSVNKIWLNRWHKQVFHSSIKDYTKGKYSFKKLEDESNKKGFTAPSGWFKEWFDDWNKRISQIKEASSNPDHSQSRRSDIAESVRGLLSRRQFDYIHDFLQEAHDGNNPYLAEQIDKAKESLKKVWKELETVEKEYLPSQSSGIEVARASFNYHTVNKKSKEYYEKEPQEAKNQLYKNTFSIIEKNNKEKYEWKLYNTRNTQSIFLFNSDQEIEWIKGYYEKQKKNIESGDKNRFDNKDKFEGDLGQRLSLSLNQTYVAMKAFKAEQKSIFYEVITHIASEQNKSYEVENPSHFLRGYKLPYSQMDLKGINKSFSLFQFKDESYKKNGKEIKINSKDKYDEFIKLTRSIQEEKIPEKKTEIAKKRGEFLCSRYCYFNEYGKFCEKYKKIAQQRGRLKAQIKGIEKEKLEALQIDFWSLIYCDQDKKQLWLVPKNNIQEARKFIYNKHNRKNYTSGNLQYLCSFESLTMRALHKLCFAKESSFVKGMPKDLKSLQKEVKQLSTKGESKRLKEKDQRKLQFFKQLLKSDYATEILQIENFDIKEINEAENLEIFEKSLETACYHVKRIVFKEEEKDHFLKEFDVTTLSISSYDLEDRNKKTPSEDRYHTELWKSFWESIDKPNEVAEVRGFSVGNIRLNPEVKIRWREADESLKKYFKKRNFPEKFKHRRLQDQFTVHFTLALNAGKRYEDLAFSKPEHLLEKINDFNKRLNKEMDFKTAWKYGIDRGQKELATLCLVKFDPDKDKENSQNTPKPEFPENIPCYKLKDYTLTGCIHCGELESNGHNEDCCAKKDDKNEWRPVIKNLSYFVNEKYLKDENLFKKGNASFLDLTAAKIVKGEIITNGDVMTFLKLRKAVAKRRLYDLHYQGQIQDAVNPFWSDKEHGSEKKDKKRPDKVLNIKTSNGEQTIYWYVKKYENILIDPLKNIKYSRDSIESSLENYLNELRREDKERSSANSKRDKEDHTPTVLQINHLRNALAANMVGIISHLQKKYPGFIVLEDLDKYNLEREFLKNNIIIHRKLENALYNKFQSLGLVPPHVKDIIRLREEMRKKQNKSQNKSQNPPSSSQIGSIVFVDKSNTSRSCPYCGTKHCGTKQDREDWQDEKFRQERFICDACGFDTYLFKNKDERVENHKPEVNENNKEKFELFKHIDDPDKVAAYNIAKKIKRSEDIGKWSLYNSVKE